MGILHKITDGLTNLVANLGTGRDKAAWTSYVAPYLTDQQLTDAYRAAWLPQKIVNIPAKDALRKWRSWQAEADQITAIEAEEKRLGLRGKIFDALLKGRLYGGGAVFIGDGSMNPQEPLKADQITKGGIKYLTVMSRTVLKARDFDEDPISERYGKPVTYSITGAGNVTDIHWTRLVPFLGVPYPDEKLVMANDRGWGDSILHAVLDAVKNADSTAANIASLIFEAKVDVIKIPGFMNGLSDPGYETQVLNRLMLAARAKGINGALLLDAEEDYQQKSASFATLPDILTSFLQIVSGAADIPVTRLLGQAPAGMNSTGESDLRNYYDGISSMQELTIQPAMSVLDECLIRSALGTRPPDIHYLWTSLWQSTAKERADIGKITAETIKVLGDSKLIPEQALSQAAVNLLVENGVMPGLDQAVEEFGNELPEEETDEDAPAALGDAAPRSLYVSRRVTNAGDLLAWAKAQGFESTMPAEDLHVTIAYSRDKVDWMKVGTPWNGDRDGGMTVPAGGARIVEPLGIEGAVVLLFNSSELAWRHMAIREAGASWDHPEYQPHITVTYQKGDLDLSSVEPYRGPIELGPEIFEEIPEDWKKLVREQTSE